jgi:alditol oxidase
VWIKTEEPIDALYEAPRALKQRHPIPGGDPRHCTEQGGIAGHSFERLPHFRLGGVPSAGDELQSEYVVAAEAAVDALRALRSIGAEIAPALHTSEIRAVAADTYWLSPFFEQSSVAFHFTWRPTEKAQAAIGRVERALEPWQPRPHWGKLFTLEAATVARRYPRLGSFFELRDRLDPDRKFSNAFVDSLETGLVRELFQA